MNTNDAFSALRLDTYKNFLRIKIKDNEVTIYPLGLDAVPRRDDWVENRDGNGPIFVPPTPLAYHLIEPAIVVRT
jgi:hypothetical protein